MKRIHLTCGCCNGAGTTDKCRCELHEDATNGKRSRVCDYCAALAFAPLDKTYRFDPLLGQYFYKPQGITFPM